MPPIKSINAPRYMVGPTGVIEAPPILTQAVPEPPKPTMTYFAPDRIVGMTVFENQIYVATENGVYVQRHKALTDNPHIRGDAFFKRLKFEIVEEPNE